MQIDDRYWIFIYRPVQVDIYILLRFRFKSSSGQIFILRFRYILLCYRYTDAISISCTSFRVCKLEVSLLTFVKRF